MAPKKTMSRSESFGKFVHTTDEQGVDTYCGTRTSGAWGKIIFFYFMFYGVLTAFWALNFGVMVSLMRGQKEGPLINNQAPLADVEGYATIQTGWTQLYPDEPEFTFSPEGLIDNNETVHKFFAKQYTTGAIEYFQSPLRCGEDFGYNFTAGTNNTGSPCIFARMNRVFYQPETDKPVKCTFIVDGENDRFKVDDKENKLNATVVGYPSGEAQFDGGESNPKLQFLNQDDYEDPIIAIKLDLTEFNVADLDNIKLTCDITGVQKGNFFTRFTVKAPGAE